MKFSRVALSALTVGTLVGLVGLSQAARVTQDTHDLTPRFEKGKTLEVANTFEMSFNLDNAEIMMGDQPLPMVPTVNINVEAEEVLQEEILTVGQAGELKSITRHYETSTSQVSGQAGMGDQTEDLDEEKEGPLAGRTLRISMDAEGALAREDLSNDGKEEDEWLDELEEGELNKVDLDEHFEFLLPSSPKSIGDTWDIAGPFQEKIKKMIAASAASQGDEEDAAKMEEVFETILEKFQATATGKLVSVDGDIANIDYSINAELNFDGLGELIAKVAEEADEIPQDMDGEVVLKLSLKGSGKFDLAAHQLREFAMEGDFDLTVEMSMTMPQMEIDMSMSGALSGTLAMTGGVTVQ